MITLSATAFTLAVSANLKMSVVILLCFIPLLSFMQKVCSNYNAHIHIHMKDNTV